MGRPRIDLTGQSFGLLTVLKRVENDDNKHPKYECLCECGNIKMIAAASLRSGSTNSCGCLRQKTSSEKIIDLTGQRFGKLVVLERAEDHVSENGRQRPQWKVLCDCGTECTVLGENLRSGNTQSCGCVYYEKRGLQSEDLAGKRFGRFVVLYMMDERDKNGRILWWARCDCGDERAVSGHDLKSGAVKSCGCGKAGNNDYYLLEDLSGLTFGKLTAVHRVENYISEKEERAQYLCICECGEECVVLKKDLLSGSVNNCGCIGFDYHLETASHHGMSRSRLYNIWQGIKQRVFNPKHHKFPNYGERGITMCKEWFDSFKTFRDWAYASGYNDDLYIERIDNDGDYEPSNCCWATLKEQANNKTTSVFVTIEDKIHTISEWCDILDIKNKGTVYARYSYGWRGKDLFENLPKKAEPHKEVIF